MKKNKKEKLRRIKRQKNSKLNFVVKHEKTKIKSFNGFVDMFQ